MSRIFFRDGYTSYVDFYFFSSIYIDEVNYLLYGE